MKTRRVSSLIPYRGGKYASTEDKLRVIRTMYMMIYNDDKSLLPLAVEFFHTIGHVLAGTPPIDLDLRNIDKQTLIKELSAEN